MFAADWPLTARDGELRRVVDTVLGRGGAVLAGPAGVGKSRLAREALRAVAGPGGTSRWAVASLAASSVPLAALITFTGDAPAGPDEATLLGRAAAVLRGASVVGVDDAHLLDPVSAALLLQLVTEQAVRLVVTVRSGEDTPDAVTALWKDGLLERIEIAPLTQAQTAEVLAAGLGGPVDKISAQRLFEVTQGNVLWLRQLVDGEVAAGRLASAGGVWHWAGDPQLSPALSDLIKARIGRLTPGGREVLELLALGEPIDLDLLNELVGPGSVEGVAQRGLVTVARDEHGLAVRLAHPLFGEAVRAELSTPRARRLRGTLAQSSADAGAAGPADAMRRAMLLVDSDLPADPKALLAGARQAAAVADVPVAVRLVAAARDAGGGFEAQLLFAYLLYWGQRGEEAEPEFAAAAELATTDLDTIRVVLARVTNLGGILGRLVEADGLLDRAAAALADRGSQVDLAAGRAILATLRGKVSDGSRQVRAVLEAPMASQTAVAYAGWAAAILAALRGWDPADGETAQRAYAAAAGSADTAPTTINIGYWEALGLALAGSPDAARASLRRYDDVSPFVRFMVDFFHTPIDLAVGRVRTCARTCRDSMLYTPGTRGGWMELAHATACQAYAMAGDAARAAQAWQIVQENRERHIEIIEPMLMLAPAWLAAAEGAVSQAAELAVAAANAAEGCQQWAIELNARHTAVCFGHPEQATRLAELADRVYGPRSDAAAAHAAALAAGDTAGLTAAGEALESCGLLLVAADAFAQAATLHRRLGESAHAMSAAATAADLAARCEDARTPALIAALTPLPITSREREVATLAQAGLSNKEIADRLHVSVRTVEGHVYRACTKLGVPDRVSLAELVGKLR